MALVEGDRCHAQQRVAGRARRREVGCVDRRLGDVHPIGGQRVQLGQAAARPGAGRDDRSRGRQDRAFSRPGLVGPAVGRAVTERHVDEHDQPQTARLRHEYLRGRRGNEPVEQHDGAIGDPLHGAGKGGERRRVGSAPEAGYGVLVHRPAEEPSPLQTWRS